MDDLDFAQPRHCGIVMHDIPGGWGCRACGDREFAPGVAVPLFDGPSIHGG